MTDITTSVGVILTPTGVALQEVRFKTPVEIAGPCANIIQSPATDVENQCTRTLLVYLIIMFRIIVLLLIIKQ